MITGLILTIMLLPLTALMNLLPTAGNLGLNTIATTITSSSFFPTFGWINNYFPVTYATDLLTIMLTTLATMFTIRMTIWLYHQFWGND